jgi:hypothetical protein
MELKKKYIVLEINEDEEEDVKEWAKSKEIKIVPKTFKGVEILNDLNLGIKEDSNQVVIEEFIQSLLFPMGKVLTDEGIKVEVFTEIEYEDEYKMRKIYLNDKNLEKEIELFYDVVNIVELFNGQTIGIIEDIYSELYDYEKELYGYDVFKRIIREEYIIKKQNYNKVF